MDRSTDGGIMERLWFKMMIISKYRTQRAFAMACQKPDTWVSEIVVGARKPNEEEERLIMEKLELDQTDKLFL